MDNFLRYILLIFLFNFFISCAGHQYSTSDGESIPFGVNAVLIEIESDDKVEVLQKAQNHLIENGYEIDQIIEEEFLVVTSFKNVRHKDEELRRLLFLNARIINVDDKNFLLFTGEYRGGGSIGIGFTDIGSSGPSYILEDKWRGYRKIYHPKYSGPNERIAWEELLRVAESFNGNLGFATL